MKPVFADSSYYLALMSVQDIHHDSALQWSRSSSRPLVSTEFVLLEVANGLCSVGRRGAFGALLAGLQDSPSVLILPASQELFGAGVELYLRRPDKDWSLTDCISFVVMKEQGITEALTADHHFEQAGYKALLK